MEPTTATPRVNAVRGAGCAPRRGCSALWGSARRGRVLPELAPSLLTVLQNSSFATVLQKLLGITWIDGQATSVNPKTNVKFQNGHCRAQALKCASFSSCCIRAQQLRLEGSGAWAHWLWHMSSAAPRHVGSSQPGMEPASLVWHGGFFLFFLIYFKFF